jgi:hypothetical protein
MGPLRIRRSSNLIPRFWTLSSKEPQRYKSQKPRLEEADLLANQVALSKRNSETCFKLWSLLLLFHSFLQPEITESLGLHQYNRRRFHQRYRFNFHPRTRSLFKQPKFIQMIARRIVISNCHFHLCLMIQRTTLEEGWLEKGKTLLELALAPLMLALRSAKDMLSCKHLGSKVGLPILAHITKMQCYRPLTAKLHFMH